MIKLFYISLIVFLLLGCSYKPLSKYSKNVNNKDIFIKVSINPVDPENSIIIKDSLYKALKIKFQSNFVSQKNSQIDIDLTFNNVSFSNIQYNSLGFVSIKRAKVILTTKVFLKEKNKNITFKTDGIYDFMVENDTLTDSDRFEAIKYASSKAIDSMIVKLSISNITNVK
jgi:hypothetical protein